MLTTGLVYLHVTSGLVLAGEILFAMLWLRASIHAPRSAQVTSYVVATMAATSRGVALPAILVNLLTGLALLHARHTALAGAIWLWVALLLYAIVTGLWHGVLIPLRKKMAVIIEGAGGDAPPEAYEPLARRWISVSGYVVILLAVILGLMIARPTI